MSKKKTDTQLENRTAERHELKIRTVVHFRESEEETWNEVTEITTVSRNGAAFTVSRECPVGRLVSLVMEMPREFRIYDHDEDVYPMLSVVQNCCETTVDEKPAYSVGVAFIGKKMPDGFKEHPTQCYRITGMNSEGLWSVAEAARQFKPRKYSRFWRRIEILVTLRDHETRTSSKETVFTREISLGGMSVWGPLDAGIGEKIKIASREHDFFAHAIVRNRMDNETNESRSTIHLEFVGAEFPVEKLFLPAAHPHAEGDGDGHYEKRDLVFPAAEPEIDSEAASVKDAEIVRYD
jgi:hypothetical protein